MIYRHIFGWWCRCFLTMSWSGRFFNVIQTSFFDFFFFGSGHWSSSIWQRTWEQSQIINTLATTEKNMFLRHITTNFIIFFLVCFYLPGSNIYRIQIGSWGTRGFGKNCCGIRTATNTIVIHMNTYGWYR